MSEESIIDMKLKGVFKNKEELELKKEINLKEYLMSLFANS
jgi:hypothetical protein